MYSGNPITGDGKDEVIHSRVQPIGIYKKLIFMANEQTNSEFANWYLGHNHSVYWTHTENERREIYTTKCMPSLTVLGYSSLDARSKNIEVAMKEKDQEIVMLKKDIKDMKDEWHALLSEPEKFITMLQEGRGKDKTN
jgi:hypothetical protein